MSNDKETFRGWLDKQKEVKWKLPTGFVIHLDYNGVRCAGILTKTFIKGKMHYTSITIRPIIGPAESTTINFKLP